MSMIVAPYRYGVSGGDPNWANVTGLFHFEGTNASTLVGAVNESTSGVSLGNITSSAFGPTHSSTQKKFGTTSASFQAGAYAATNGGTLGLAMGTGDFTIEFWMFQTALQTANLFDVGNTVGGTVLPLLYTDSSGNLFYYTNNTNRISSTGGLLTINTWHAIAAARVSGNTRMFIDGAQVGSTYVDSSNWTGTPQLVLPCISTTWIGYIDELRITAGVGRYAANYTPAAAAFPNF